MSLISDLISSFFIDENTDNQVILKKLLTIRDNINEQYLMFNNHQYTLAGVDVIKSNVIFSQCNILNIFTDCLQGDDIDHDLRQYIKDDGWNPNEINNYKMIDDVCYTDGFAIYGSEIGIIDQLDIDWIKLIKEFAKIDNIKIPDGFDYEGFMDVYFGYIMNNIFDYVIVDSRMSVDK